jgi:DNA-binding GntR family transcriptional regulator
MSRERLSPIRLEGYQPLRDMVFDVLMNAIMMGQLQPGERLLEVQLAEEMGVSRTPVREAIRRLELEGFVVMVPRKGAYVAGLSVNDVESVYEIRTALETLAVKLAAQRMEEEDFEQLDDLAKQMEQTWQEGNNENWVLLDARFHELLYKFSRNDRLVQMMGNIMEQLSRYRIISLANVEVRHNSLHEHKELIDALRRRDSEAAEKAAAKHIENTKLSLIDMLQAKFAASEEVYH